MADEEIREENLYSITWYINNFSYCWQKTGEALASPSFIFNKNEESSWKLLLFPRGHTDDNYLTLRLLRDKDCDVVEKVKLKYLIHILSVNGLELHKSATKNPSDEVSVKRTAKSDFKGDTLTLRLRIAFEGKATENSQLFVRTIINVESITFDWPIKNFSSLKTDEIKTFEIKSASNRIMTKINFFHTEAEYSDANLFMNICPIDQYMKYFTLKSFILDSAKNALDTGEFNYWFDNGKSSTFPFSLMKNYLMYDKKLYLPNDVLTLRFEITFSTGLAFEGIEKVVSEYISLTPNEITHNWKNSNSKEKIFENPCALTSDLLSLYKYQSLCDMKLRTKTNIFHVHTSILAARSAVFRAMFSSDMKEKLNGCVDVSDLEDETIRRMLLYFYTDQLEDLKWDVAFHVYKAADKYSVLSLKEKCSVYLKSNLDLENVCEALILSDLHMDKDLKVVAQNYILKNAKKILKSEKWKLFVEANSKLAIETMSRNWIAD